MTNQAAGLQGLTIVNLAGNRAQSGIQLFNATDGVDLRKLRRQLVVLHWVGRVLIF
ncbi:Uncharacterised protein [Yersinia enterocolitica]|nr:Uncharacterised protein [Yersinia enterocolitica]